MEWIKPSEMLPPTEYLVLAHYKNILDKDRYIIAFYAPKFTIECDADFDNDWYEYCEEKDCYYLPEGWYENVEACSDYSSYYADSQDMIAWTEIPRFEAKNEN